MKPNLLNNYNMQRNPLCISGGRLIIAVLQIIIMHLWRNSHDTSTFI